VPLRQTAGLSDSPLPRFRPNEPANHGAQRAISGRNPQHAGDGRRPSAGLLSVWSLRAPPTLLAEQRRHAAPQERCPLHWMAIVVAACVRGVGSCVPADWPASGVVVIWSEGEGLWSGGSMSFWGRRDMLPCLLCLCGQVPTACCIFPSSLPSYFTAPASRLAAPSILAPSIPTLLFCFFFLRLLRRVLRLQEEWNSATGLQSDIMRAKKSWLTIGVGCCAERDSVVERTSGSGNGMSCFVFFRATRSCLLSLNLSCTVPACYVKSSQLHPTTSTNSPPRHDHLLRAASIRSLVTHQPPCPSPIRHSPNLPMGLHQPRVCRQGFVKSQPRRPHTPSTLPLSPHHRPPHRLPSHGWLRRHPGHDQ
jgi:hypothetical protein